MITNQKTVRDARREKEKLQTKNSNMYTQGTFKMIKGDSDYCRSKQQVDKTQKKKCLRREKCETVNYKHMQ